MFAGAMRSAHSFHRRMRRVTFVLCLLLLLPGCSSTTFLYNRLHHFIPWYVDDFVELNDRQQDKLDVMLADYMHLHRRQYLPRYSELITQMLSAIEGPLTEQEAARIYRELAAEMERLQDDVLNWMLTIGADLSAEQLEEFRRNLQQQQHDYEAEYVDRTEAEFRRETYTSLEDSFSDYLGRLQPSQLALLRGAAARIQRLDSDWLRMRQYRLDQLEDIFRRQPGWQDRVRTLMSDPTIPGAAAYEQAYAANLKVLLEVTVAVINSRSERQNKHLVSTLQSLRGDLLALNRQAGD